MFQKMAAHIEFNEDFTKKSKLIDGIQEGPTPTLKDQIYSGSILKEMYHKSKPNLPTADNLNYYDGG